MLKYILLLFYCQFPTVFILFLQDFLLIWQTSGAYISNEDLFIYLFYFIIDDIFISCFIPPHSTYVVKLWDEADINRGCAGA